MRTGGLKLLGAVAVSGVLVLTGCGGGGGSTGKSEASFAVAETIKETIEKNEESFQHGDYQGLDCGKPFTQLSQQSVEEFEGTEFENFEATCYIDFIGPAGSAHVPFELVLGPEWCFTLEVPTGSVMEEPGYPPIEAEGSPNTVGLNSVGVPLGKMNACVFPKPESE